MSKEKSLKRRTIDETLNRLYLVKKSAPKSVYWILLFGFIATTMAISVTAGSSNEVSIAGQSLPVYTFAGVLSSL